jgi:hypothetical protein
MEGYGGLTVGGVATAFNQAVDKVGAAGGEFSQCLREEIQRL